jgi:hypothetical protein
MLSCIEISDARPGRQIFFSLALKPLKSNSQEVNMTGHTAALSRKLLNRSAAFGSAMLATVCTSLPATSSEPALMAEQAQYQALQNISYGFGSKFTSGYFTAQSGRCSLNLMVIEKSPQDKPLSVTAARIRLPLYPGQVAGLDSEEGESLNFTCGAGAAALLVDTGARDKLIALQKGSQQDRIGLVTFP